MKFEPTLGPKKAVISMSRAEAKRLIKRLSRQVDTKTPTVPEDAVSTDWNSIYADGTDEAFVLFVVRD